MEECRSPFGGVILDPDGKPQCCRKPKPEELDLLGKVMRRAWTEDVYRNKLLTFSEQQTIDWAFYLGSERAAMLRETWDAFKDEGLKFVNEIPVVLGDQQFERGVYRMKDAKERVFRLPNPPSPLIMRDNAFSAYVINSHICGM